MGDDQARREAVRVALGWGNDGDQPWRLDVLMEAVAAIESDPTAYHRVSRALREVGRRCTRCGHEPEEHNFPSGSPFCLRSDCTCVAYEESRRQDVPYDGRPHQADLEAAEALAAYDAEELRRG